MDILPHRAPPNLQTAQGGYHGAVINEIRMLLDYVTGSPIQTLKDLVIPDPNAPVPAGNAEPVLMKNAEIMNRLNDLELKVAGGSTLVSAERTFLQLLRDALGVMVRPATGLTIAYSSMVVGNQRGPYAQSRAIRAEQAYASLAGPAWRHRWAQRFLLMLTLGVTCLAVWQSARVALGHSLLQSVQSLHVQQVALSQEMTKLLEAGRQSAPAEPAVIGGFRLAAGPVLRLCDRPRVLAWHMRTEKPDDFRMDATQMATLFETPAQQALCDRDTILAADFRIAHDGLLLFMSDWVSMIDPGESRIGRASAFAWHSVPGPASNTGAAPPLPKGQAEQTETAADQTDVDFTLGPALLVFGNYVLPIIFALLGASVYVILDFYSKLRDSLLAPRDAVLSWIRLVLGMVLGACVGLFFSSSSNPASMPTGAGLADAITLSASGLAFIAGFGVEGVFGMLDSLVRRIFSGDQDKGARLMQG